MRTDVCYQESIEDTRKELGEAILQEAAGLLSLVPGSQTGLPSQVPTPRMGHCPYPPKPGVEDPRKAVHALLGRQEALCKGPQDTEICSLPFSPIRVSLIPSMEVPPGISAAGSFESVMTHPGALALKPGQSSANLVHSLSFLLLQAPWSSHC